MNGSTDGAGNNAKVSGLVYLNGTTDYIEIYYNLNENKVYEVFILSKIDKRDVVDFTLHYIKKQIKEYGNNSKTITGKD